MRMHLKSRKNSEYFSRILCILRCPKKRPR
uniref:Uncharacterized protein n=1 Tax=Siphoviridae sp. ctUoe7 TaxID=2826355 RepID=A0A8S5N4J3_9CAUD|nr:MAG TPA: hypothetical protein [Siphoviridae sp. ctUoe7]DAZ57435.1 MAG TPA: hypothetical protein [Caudoviricetes sp.]